MAILLTMPPDWARYKRGVPYGYSVISNKDALASPGILARAREFINRMVKNSAPIGAREFHNIDGRTVLFVVEPHYHPPNEPVKPWGWHKGSTVYVAKPADEYFAQMEDDYNASITGEDDWGAEILGRKLVKRGSTGPDVIAWQNVIGAKPDGKFGPMTEAQTKQWQQLRSLKADGIVGPKTWSAAGVKFNYESLPDRRVAPFDYGDEFTPSEVLTDSDEIFELEPEFDSLEDFIEEFIDDVWAESYLDSDFGGPLIDRG